MLAVGKSKATSGKWRKTLEAASLSQTHTILFVKAIRGIFSPSSRSDHLAISTGNKDPSSSEPIGGSVDVAIGVLETSLAALKEVSSLAGKIPYISPIAGIILQALKMRDEVNLYKEEWGAVMQKLASVGSVIIDVGEMCQMHDLKEDELPPTLRAILRSLQTRVKQYDGKLSNVLQVFQAKLSLTILTQFIQERKVALTVLPGPTPEITSLPSKPQIFFGRDAELAQIIHTIFTSIVSHPARIAILGPGGHGKTTLANAVLTHAVSKNILVMPDISFLSGSDASWSHIHAALIAKECILCLDNFESPWDQDGDTKHTVEQLLSRITELHSVTVMLTMRGTERPARTQWTQPILPPLQTLGHDAGKEIWQKISDNYDEFAEELLKAVDYVPLAIDLLAHLSQVTPPSLLWKEWCKKQTGILQRGQAHKLLNIEYSIQLSINSGRMRANPSAKDLLGVLSMLPDGMHIKQVDKFEEILGDIEMHSGLHVLQQCSLIAITGERYQTIPYFTQRVLYHTGIFPSPKAQNYAEMVLEVNNTKAMLLVFRVNYEDLPGLVNAIIAFSEFHQSIGDLSDKLTSQTVQLFSKNMEQVIISPMSSKMGKIIYFSGNMEGAKHKLQEAEMLESAFDEAEALYQKL
ncbi:P-loop containing nucleoside triphosphate hydrolase protein [Multifurca ochricompacta]|uniref:P-loop containing nucleoside triphosphate hydrolase protein n=1 Tax=Multifurca ochricompacta TaxID=376703 RepID=A0AAD4LXV3_9AGAM|nr:P-loop containing nucleoside triphosphate hydrolase protein [Multifurca ochricompacta]